MDQIPPNTSSIHNSSVQTDLPEHNETLLTRDMILTVLDDLSKRILSSFQRPVRLVVHGGAAMLLHLGLYNQPGCQRRDTRDIDYIHRSFVEEWRQLGVFDAGERLQCCIDATARKFKLGRDWMNAHADVALPMANDPQGRRYDPIYTSSLKSNNVHLHTLYTSPGLVLISVTPFWAVALKLVRYQKHDPADITAILRNGTRLNGVRWSTEVLERWLRTECWAMGYENYPDWLKRDMCERIAHAVAQLNADPPADALTRPPSIDVLQPDQHHVAHQQMVSLSYPTAPHHRSHSSLALPTSHQHPPTFTDLSHRRLSRPASMTFPPPSNRHLALPPPPPPPHHQHHAQAITRTHSMPAPLSLSIPQHAFGSSSTSPPNATMHTSPTSMLSGPTTGLLVPPPYHFSQPPTTMHHLSQARPQGGMQSHSRSHKQSHSHLGLVWPSGHRQAMLPPITHGMNWPGQLFLTA